MNRRTRPYQENEEVKEIKTAGIDEACARYGLGKASMRKLAEDAGATIRIGKRYLIHFGKVDAYLLEISE